MLKVILKILVYLWALPYTLLGLTVGMLGLASGGAAQLRGGVVEFYGGGTRWFVRHLPHGEFTLALTLGHTILAQNDAALDICREHEWVHVRQFERWGPLMGPAYLGCSLWLWLRGGRPYRDNPFEREAYDTTD